MKKVWIWVILAVLIVGSNAIAATRTQGGINCTVAKSPSSGVIFPGDARNIATYSCTCPISECTIYEVDMELKGYPYNVGGVWLENAKGKKLSSVESSNIGGPIIFSENFTFRGSMTIKVMADIYWGNLPGQSFWQFRAVMTGMDASPRPRNAFPLRGKLITAEFSGVENYWIEKSNDSPSGTIVAGSQIELLKFNGHTDKSIMAVKEFDFSFGPFDGEVSNCVLYYDEQELPNQLNWVYYNYQYDRMEIAIQPNDWPMPIWLVGSTPSEISLKCDVSVNSPGQSVAVNLEMIGWWVNNNGVYFQNGVDLYAPIFEGNLLFLEPEMKHIHYAFWNTPDSPIGATAPGHHVDLMKFNAIVDQSMVSLEKLVFSYNANFQGELYDCVLVKPGSYEEIGWPEKVEYAETETLIYMDIADGIDLTFEPQEMLLQCSVWLDQPYSGTFLQVNIRGVGGLPTETGYQILLGPSPFLFGQLLTF